MAWKAFIILAVIAVGVSAGRYELNQQKRGRLQQTLDDVCTSIPDTQKDQITAMAMGAMGCMYDSVDRSIGHYRRTNETIREDYLRSVGDICAMRERLRNCYQEFLEFISPCIRPEIQAQVGAMKSAIRELFDLFCNDDMARSRNFTNDGAIECLMDRSHQLENCTMDIQRLVFEVPENTKTFEAIELCYKYDEMTSCVLGSVADCPKPSTREFIETVLYLFRSGTFCRVTVPLPTTDNNLQDSESDTMMTD